MLQFVRKKMKACEKWLSKVHLPNQPPKNTIAALINEARREGWRAALEWAEKQFIGKSAFEAEEAINKELRGL